MINWRCSICGYTLTAEAPPEVCPQCHNKCPFVDDTCYTPECGLVDPQEKK
ncbi:MAG: hypothetical protein WDA53_00640 [Bacillota bacterium]